MTTMNTATQAIGNTADFIDSRDIIARIDYLRASWTETTGESWSDFELSEDDWAADIGYDELVKLLALQEECETSGLGDEWPHGALLIHEDYFEEYAEEMAYDIGAISRNAHWPLQFIDWNRAADALKYDYIEVDFDGATYWGRA
jgi:hypothetical protein